MFTSTYEGMNKSVEKIGRTKVKDYVRASRFAQGFDELQRASPQQQEQIVMLWRSFKAERKSQGKEKNKSG